MSSKLFAVVAAGLLLSGTVYGQQDRYIVQLKDGVSPAALSSEHGLTLRHTYTHVFNGFAADLPAGRLAALANDPRVAKIEVDHPVFAFGKPSKPAPAPTEQLPAGVDRIAAPLAWLKGINGAGIGVAIVDTGLDFNHKDLNISTASFVSPGFTYTTSAQDDAGHGTHVGGIVAALDNDIDVIGVAPGATLYAVKVLDNTGSGYDSDIISGLDWVKSAKVTPPIKVVNMSLGRAASSDDSLMHTAVQNLVAAEITVVVAAGNDSSKEISQMVPAGFKEVIAVASTTAKNGASNVTLSISADTASYFTTDGAGVAISAPGEDQENVRYPRISSIGILSTALGGGTTRMSGTSMASPHVAGAVALLLQAPSTLSPAQVKDLISAGDREGVAPLDSPTTSYTFDNVREGVLYVPAILGIQ